MNSKEKRLTDIEEEIQEFQEKASEYDDAMHNCYFEISQLEDERRELLENE